MFVNLILLIFKLHIYNYRDSSSVNIYFMKLKVTKIRHNEEKISRSPTQKNLKIPQKMGHCERDFCMNIQF